MTEWGTAPVKRVKCSLPFSAKMLVPTLAPRLHEDLTPTSGRLAPRVNNGTTNIERLVFFALMGIVALIIVVVSIRIRAQIARRHPMGVAPPGHTFWSRSDAQSRNPHRRDYLERHRSSFDPALHDHRQGQLPAHPDNAHIRNSRVAAGFPFEPIFFSAHAFGLSGRPPSLAPSYDDPESFHPVAVQPLKGESEKDPLSENNNDCPICFEEYTPERPAVIGAPCRHVLCKRCWKLIVDASKEAAGMGRFGGAGDAEVARCHACRTPYVTKTKPAEENDV